MSKITDELWEPQLVVFSCTARVPGIEELLRNRQVSFASNARVVPAPCSGKVESHWVLNAFAHGADGVLIIGCPPGQCRNHDGNLKCHRRAVFLRTMIRRMNVEEQRLRMEWIGTDDPPRLRAALNQMVELIQNLGQIAIAARHNDWNAEFELLELELVKKDPLNGL